MLGTALRAEVVAPRRKLDLEPSGHDEVMLVPLVIGEDTGRGSRRAGAVREIHPRWTGCLDREPRIQGGCSARREEDEADRPGQNRCGHGRHLTAKVHSGGAIVHPVEYRKVELLNLVGCWDR